MRITKPQLIMLAATVIIVAILYHLNGAQPVRMTFPAELWTNKV